MSANCQPHPRHITPLWLWHAQLNISLFGIVLESQKIYNFDGAGHCQSLGWRCKTHGVIRHRGPELTSGAWWPVQSPGERDVTVTRLHWPEPESRISAGQLVTRELTHSLAHTLNSQSYRDLKFTVHQLDSQTERSTTKENKYMFRTSPDWNSVCVSYILYLMSIRSICIWKSNEA